MKNDIINIAYNIRNIRYPDSTVVFVAGSYIRGDFTAFSDIDLVVVYESLKNAYRESFLFDGFPVEAFVHDPETLNYFFMKVDRPSGVPALPQMVREGIEIPTSNGISRSLKALANSVIDMGPPALRAEDDKQFRYGITDLINDIRDPRSYTELVATAAQLYGLLADYYFRSNGLWSAKGKSVPRVLQNSDPEFSEIFIKSFEKLFKNGNASALIALAEEVLAVKGGLLFQDHKLDAPADWREPLL